MSTKRVGITGRKRRSFGRMVVKRVARTVKKGDEKGKKKVYEYIECSYLTPIEAFSKWPHLPNRQYKNFPNTKKGEDEASNWLNDIDRSIDRGTWMPPQVKKVQERAKIVTFGEYATEYIETKHKTNGEPVQDTTKDKYREYLRIHLQPVFGNRALNSITSDDIQHWYDSFPIRKGGYGESQRRHVYLFLKGVFTQAATKPLNDNGDTLLKTNPCRITISKPKRKVTPVIANLEELEKLSCNMPDWLALSVLLCGMLGLREGECLALQVRDIDLDVSIPVLHVRRATKTVSRDHVRVVELGKTKTESSVRDILIPPFLVERIKLHVSAFTDGKPKSQLFTARRSTGLVKESTLRNAWYRAVKTVPRLKGMRFYDLRHTALSNLAAVAGADRNVLKAVAGHTLDTTMENYQHATIQGEQRAVEGLQAAWDTKGSVTAMLLEDTHLNKDAEKRSIESTNSLHLDDILIVLNKMPLDKRNEVLSELPSDVLAQIINNTVKGENE